MSDTGEPPSATPVSDAEAAAEELYELVLKERKSDDGTWPVRSLPGPNHTPALFRRAIASRKRHKEEADPRWFCRLRRRAAACCCCVATSYARSPMKALVAVAIWMLVYGVVFDLLGVFDSRYFSFGPHPLLKFVGAPIDTWQRWGALVGVRVVGVFLETLVDDAIPRWIRTTFWNPPTSTRHRIPYPAWVCRLIILTYDSYVILTVLFRIYLFLLQADFSILVISSHLCARQLCVVSFWLRHKVYRRRRPNVEDGLLDSDSDDGGSGLSTGDNLQAGESLLES